ncbi:MAG: peptidase T [Bdellovibrionales bacterium RIFOXYA1_FULL_36_14]|nr:MAG: peptidase T [Bdellovibrionales bacterium RIFOXYA1_FULL_36_14]
MKRKLISRFVKYAKINTKSQHDVNECPSTSVQFDLANEVANELKELGINDLEVDKNCYLIGKLRSNIPSSHKAYGKTPVIGFLAHLDTAPDLTGENVKPQIIENYDGGDIVIGFDEAKKEKILIGLSENPELAKCLGHTIITTDGNTLLGADDKAGIAAIVTALEQITNDKNFLHGDIYFCFNPDEEVGRGTVCFPREKFPVNFAYTIDGGSEGELNKETFNADNAKVTVYGKDIHPGSAKDIMVNAVLVASYILDKLPREMSPDKTSNHEGFLHPTEITGSTGQATIRMILRDFTEEGLAEKNKILEEIIGRAKQTFPGCSIDLEINKSYRNMLKKLDENPYPLKRLEAAASQVGVSYRWLPIRGGTDGAELTRMGIPTPNIFTGGKNFHGKTEWLSIDVLMKTTEIIKNLVRV